MHKPQIAPTGVVASDSVPWAVFERGDRFGIRYRHLTLAAMGEPYHVGVAIEELPPGRQTVPFHFHMLEEEHVLILEGSCTLRLGDSRRPLNAGDYVCYPAGQKAGHCMINETDQPCRYLILGDSIPHEVAVYPDSEKVQVRWLGERYDRRVVLGYWDREAGAGAPDPDPPRTADDPAPIQPVATDAIPWRDWSQGGRYGGRIKHLTKAALGEMDYRIGVVTEELSPGKQSCPFHFHLLEEEHVLVLEGAMTLRLGDNRIGLKAGDFASFPAARHVGHCFINETDQPCRYVVIGENNPNEVCVYPDSNKVSVIALGEIFDLAARREYWDGEAHD